MRFSHFSMALALAFFCGTAAAQTAPADASHDDHAKALQAGREDVEEETLQQIQAHIDHHLENCKTKPAPGCCFMSGTYYEKIKKDYVQAREYYDKACKINESYCWGLGKVYQEGLGVEVDTKSAVELYTKSCNAKNADGCLELANMYVVGVGVPQDFGKAYELFKETCDTAGQSKGHAGPGCFSIGLLYYTGNGVDRNVRLAKDYFAKSCELGNDIGCEYYRRLH